MPVTLKSAEMMVKQGDTYKTIMDVLMDQPIDDKIQIIKNTIDNIIQEEGQITGDGFRKILSQPYETGKDYLINQLLYYYDENENEKHKLYKFIKNSVGKKEIINEENSVELQNKSIDDRKEAGQIIETTIGHEIYFIENFIKNLIEKFYNTISYQGKINDLFSAQGGRFSTSDGVVQNSTQFSYTNDFLPDNIMAIKIYEGYEVAIFGYDLLLDSSMNFIGMWQNDQATFFKTDNYQPSKTKFITGPTTFYLDILPKQYKYKIIIGPIDKTVGRAHIEDNYSFLIFNSDDNSANNNINDVNVDDIIKNGHFYKQQIILNTKTSYETSGVTIGQEYTYSSSATNFFNSIQYPCIQGDIFEVHGVGDNNHLPWVFIDSENKILERAKSDTVKQNIIAPKNAVSLILNNNKNNLYISYKYINGYNYLKENLEHIKIKKIQFQQDIYCSVDDNNDILVKFSSNYQLATVPCSPNDIFSIQAGASISRSMYPWMFVDANYKIKLLATENALTPKIIKAPQDAAYLILDNNKTSYPNFISYYIPPIIYNIASMYNENNTYEIGDFVFKDNYLYKRKNEHDSSYSQSDDWDYYWEEIQITDIMKNFQSYLKSLQEDVNIIKQTNNNVENSINDFTNTYVSNEKLQTKIDELKTQIWGENTLIDGDNTTIQEQIILLAGTQETLQQQITNNQETLQQQITQTQNELVQRKVLPIRWNNDHYIKMSNGIVEQIPQFSNNYNCFVLDCEENDVFTISGVSDNVLAPVYIFLDINGQVLKYYSYYNKTGNYKIFNRLITAPSGAKKIIVNNCKILFPDAECYIGKYKIITMSSIEQALKSIPNYDIFNTLGRAHLSGIYPDNNYVCTDFISVKAGDTLCYGLFGSSSAIIVGIFDNNELVDSINGKSNTEIAVGEYTFSKDEYVCVSTRADKKDESYIYMKNYNGNILLFLRYWENALENARERIQQRELKLQTGDHFFFVTDPHWAAQKNKMSPILIDQLSDDFNIRLCLLGGDNIKAIARSIENGYKEIYNYIHSFKNPSLKLFTTVGNHDYYYYEVISPPKTGRIPAYIIYNALERHMEDFCRTSGDLKGAYYDNESQKIRYIQFNHTTLTMNTETLESIMTLVENYCDEVPDGWTIVLLSHAYWDENGVAQLGKDWSKKIFTLKARGAPIAVWLVGHTHLDKHAVIDKTAFETNELQSDVSNSNAKLLVVCTTTDNISDGQVDKPGYQRADGTDTEAAFDVVHLDTTKKHIYFTRVGGWFADGGADQPVTGDRAFNYEDGRKLNYETGEYLENEEEDITQP